MGVLNRKSKVSELDTAVARAIAAYASSHPTEPPEAPQHSPMPPRVARILRRPASQPRPQEALQQPVSPLPDPVHGHPLHAQRKGSGALSQPLQMQLLRDEVGAIRAATFVGPSGQQHEMKLQRDEVGRAARLVIDGNVLLVQRSASGAAVALVPTDQGQPYIHEGKPVLPAPLNAE